MLRVAKPFSERQVCKLLQVCYVAYLRDGSHIVTLNSDENNDYLVIWDVESGRKKQSFTLNGEGVVSLICSLDGQYIICADRGSILDVWTIKEGVAVQQNEIKFDDSMN